MDGLKYEETSGLPYSQCGSRSFNNHNCIYMPQIVSAVIRSYDWLIVGTQDNALSKIVPVLHLVSIKVSTLTLVISGDIISLKNQAHITQYYQHHNQNLVGVVRRSSTTLAWAQAYTRSKCAWGDGLFGSESSWGHGNALETPPPTKLGKDLAQIIKINTNVLEMLYSFSLKLGISLSLTFKG